MMDCGPTCIRMIARHYGKHYSISGLRKKAFINQQGTSMLGLSEAAEAIGFHTLAIKATFTALCNDVVLPCIVHWGQNHFVVVYGITAKYVKVADPAGGLVNYTHSEFCKKWTAWRGTDNIGVALLMEPSPAFFQLQEDSDGTSPKRMTFLFSYLYSYRHFLLQIGLSLLAGSLIQIFFPFLTQSIVDIGINTQNLNFIYVVLSGQLMLVVGKTTVDFIRRWLLVHLSARINISILSDFLIKLMKLPLPFFDQKRIGDLLRRIDDHHRIEQFLSSSSLNILFSLFNFVVFGVVLMVYNIPIFLIFAAGSAAYVIFIMLFMKKRKELDQRRFTQQSTNQGNLIELIQGIQDIKLNNCEKQKRWEWENIQARLFKINLGSTQLQQYQEAGSLLINELKNILITIMAAKAVIDGTMTLGMMLAVQFIIGQLNAPIMELVGFLREYQDARISMDRIQEIHQMDIEDTADPLMDSSSVKVAALHLKQVSFCYPEPDAPLVLSDINLLIPPGKVTAIVGSSGSGKTTLLKLLLRFYPPGSGSIYLDARNINALPISLWRKHCGVVMQDGNIFSGTLATNIALSAEEPDYGLIVKAARVANLHEDIEALPFGYNTLVGQKGEGLSQGQKQRLLIARAVYRDPQFLFFDEATSSLDARNERIIMNNLADFFEGRTVVVIAHRLSTVKNAHQIVVLDHGKIAEVGTHTQLVDKKGTYYNLIRNQLDLEA